MSLTISRILHAGYVFTHADVRIVCDPIFRTPFAGNCHAFPTVRFDGDQLRGLRFSAVFISHYHDDHCCFESLDLIARDTPIYLYCVHDELFRLVRRLGFTSVHALVLDRPVRVGEIEVTALRAFDADVDCLLKIAAGDVAVLNVVDALIEDNTLDDLARQRWDVVLWPFQTMREIAVLAPALAEPASPALPHEFLTQLRALAPRVLVPSSCQFRMEPWSWMNHHFFPVSYARFAREVGEVLPRTRILRLDPSRGVMVRPERIDSAPALPWVQLLTSDAVDYDFDPDYPPTPTAEIARRFDALTPDGAAHVDTFCRTSLRERFGALAGPTGWRLSVFDHEGREVAYTFGAPDSTPPWRTEIPAAKLYGALVRGEALTSLYLRVTAAPAEADVLEDPLIQILYGGVFAATQKEQLRRLSHPRRD